MQENLKRLLNATEMLDTVIAELVGDYNQDTVEYHELHDELERLTKANFAAESTIRRMNRTNSQMNEEIFDLKARNAELEEALQKQNDLLIQQANKLNELNGKHNAVIEVANSNIRSLNAEVTTLRNEVRELRTLNPKKLKKTVEEQKVKLAERAATISRLEGEKKNALRNIDRLSHQLEQQKVGFWQQGQERVLPFLTSSVIRDKSLHAESNLELAAWWQHECGLKILCGYDKVNDEVYMCNPSNESGNMHTPTIGAEKAMLSYFREQVKKGNK